MVPSLLFPHHMSLISKNLFRGHRTGSGNSGVEEYLNKKKHQGVTVRCRGACLDHLRAPLLKLLLEEERLECSIQRFLHSQCQRRAAFSTKKVVGHIAVGAGDKKEKIVRDGEPSEE